MDDEEIQAELESIAAEYDEDFASVEKIYEDKLEHIQNADVIGVDEEEFPVHALRTVRSNLQSSMRSGGGPSGEVSELPILAIGILLTTENWGQNNDHVAVGIGITAPEDTAEENRPPGLCAFIMNESQGLDIGKAREIWQWGNHIRGWFTIEKLNESFQSRSRTYYVGNSTDRSKIEEADFSGSLPNDPDAVRSFIGENFIKEKATLETLGEQLSVDGEEFGSGFLDLRRFEGQVVDSFRRLPGECEPDQNPFGKYVLIDDTVASPEELEEDERLRTEDDMENGRTPGLQVFLPPEEVKHGEDSTVEVYGALERNGETGQITMRGAGACPVIAFPREDYDSGGDHDDVEQESL